MKPYYQEDRATIYCGDCIEVMTDMPENSVDAIVTDPPYGLEFMGKEWDRFTADASWNKRGENWHKKFGNSAYGRILDKAPTGWSQCGLPFQQWTTQWATQALRVLKPGGYLLAFGGTRTSHRLVCGLEDAGFEIRDTICWLYGQGFPKSEDVSQAIDKKACREQLTEELGRKPTKDEFKVAWKQFREVIGKHPNPLTAGGTGRYEWNVNGQGRTTPNITTPTTEAAKEWQGWGTALKPAVEFICVARKPLSEKTVAENVLKWGTGGMDIDGARIEYQGDMHKGYPQGPGGKSTQLTKPEATSRTEPWYPPSKGRWPANVILDEEAARMLDEQSGERQAGHFPKEQKESYTGKHGKFGKYDTRLAPEKWMDSGGASRFYYCAKASSSERGKNNKHPTCKPIALMEYLIKLVSRKDSVILDPFGGSMSTVLGAVALGRRIIAIEQSEEYCEMLKGRCRQMVMELGV